MVPAEWLGDQKWLFNWWRLNRSQFPDTAAAAKDYLPIPASEVGVERSFSEGLDVLGIRRHSMNADTMQMLMMLGAKYRSEFAELRPDISFGKAS